MRKLQCDSCGGIVDRETLTCRSCGMQYEFDHQHELRLITETRKTDILHGCVIINDEDLHHYGEDIIQHSIKKLASKMTRDLIPYMEWERESNPRFAQTTIYARLRVARPSGERGESYDKEIL